jgi:hypothetical protein
MATIHPHGIKHHQSPQTLTFFIPLPCTPPATPFASAAPETSSAPPHPSPHPSAPGRGRGGVAARGEGTTAPQASSTYRSDLVSEVASSSSVRASGRISAANVGHCSSPWPRRPPPRSPSSPHPEGVDLRRRRGVDPASTPPAAGVDPTTRTRSRSDSTTRPPPRIHVQVCVLLPFSPSHLNSPLLFLISISLLGFSSLEAASRRSGAGGQKEKVSNSGRL